jgi:acyl-CoA thioester hydrolase
MGHQNASFYLTQATEGAAVALLTAGASQGAISGHHISFARELHAGTPVHMLGGFLRTSDQLVQALINSETGDLAALIVTQWQEPVLPAVPEDMWVDVNPEGVFRGVPYRRAAAPARDMAMDHRMVRTGYGCFDEPEGDRQAGLVRHDALLGRIADATRYLSRLFERTARASAPPGVQLGTAAVECRVDYWQLPEVGGIFEVRSAFTELSSKSRRVVHWMINGDTGAPICAVHTLELNFDLQSRRARATDGAVREAMAVHLCPELSPVDANDAQSQA